MPTEMKPPFKPLNEMDGHANLKKRYQNSNGNDHASSGPSSMKRRMSLNMLVWVLCSQCRLHVHFPCAMVEYFQGLSLSGCIILKKEVLRLTKMDEIVRGISPNNLG